MGREGPVLYYKDSTAALVKVLIPEEKLHFIAAQLVKLCCATSVCLAGREVLSCDMSLGSISLDLQLFPENNKHLGLRLNINKLVDSEGPFDCFTQ